jgi:hypothetical protein
MLLLFLMLLVAVALAAFVMAFAAFPHRGQPIPYAGRLSDALVKVNQKLGL